MKNIVKATTLAAAIFFLCATSYSHAMKPVPRSLSGQIERHKPTPMTQMHIIIKHFIPIFANTMTPQEKEVFQQMLRTCEKFTWSSQPSKPKLTLCFLNRENIPLFSITLLTHSYALTFNQSPTKVSSSPQELYVKKICTQPSYVVRYLLMQAFSQSLAPNQTSESHDELKLRGKDESDHICQND